jgi:hypothetical protein
MNVVREFRHIRALKWGGRGHDPTGAEGTSKGELSIPCRGCPHPNINIPLADLDEYVDYYVSSPLNSYLVQLAQCKICCNGCQLRTEGSLTTQ